MSSETPIRITRRRNFFIIDNAFFDRGIAAKIGPDATSLYCYLVRRAGQENTTWPSQNTMAEATGMSERQIRRCLDVLETELLISRNGWKGVTRNIHILDLPPDSQSDTPAQQADTTATQSPPPGPIGRSTPAQQADNKYSVDKDSVKKTQEEDLCEGVNPPRSEDGFRLEEEKPTLAQQVWTSYDSCYRKRYSVTPVRNAKINGQISQLVKRLGEEAPAIAAFFITHNDMRYVKSCHSVGLLLMDAEKLRTEWARGQKVTHTEAKSLEQRDSAVGQVDRVFQRIQSRGVR